jgi:predicted RNA-binding Zn-ribbon protein involved in translation (DUF1610 family)
MDYMWIAGIAIIVIFALSKAFRRGNSNSEERREGESIGDYLRRLNIHTVGDKIKCYECGKVMHQVQALNEDVCPHCGVRWERARFVIVTCGTSCQESAVEFYDFQNFASHHLH